MPSHHLQYERPRVRRRRRINVINRFTYPMQCCGCTDREIRHTHIVVDRPNEPNDTEVTVLFDLFVRDLAIRLQRADVGGPFGTKDISTRQRAITATDDERIDAFFDEVVCSSKASLWRAECLGARCSDERSALLHELRSAALDHRLAYIPLRPSL